MASITVRNLDEATKAQLRVRAAQNGRSMEEEVRVILRDVLAHPSGSAQGLGERGAAPFRTKNLAELLRERFAEVGGLDIELPPREMGPEPLDFSGPEYGACDEEEDSSSRKDRKDEKEK